MQNEDDDSIFVGMCASSTAFLLTYADPELLTACFGVVLLAVSSPIPEWHAYSSGVIVPLLQCTSYS